MALATTYDTCAADGCDRPYAWSELHHEDPWSRGGRTDLAKAIPCADTTTDEPTTRATPSTSSLRPRGKKYVIFALRT